MAGTVSVGKKSGKYAEDMKLIANLKSKMKRDAKTAHVPASVDEFCRIYGKRDKSIAMLSRDQRIAVGSIAGQNLLFAVPGSGKTAVIVARIGYMLHGNHGMDIHPGSLVTLTFSRKAAMEMAERYGKIFPEDKGQGPCFKTIHSFCLNEILKPLKRCGYDFPENILSSSLKITDEESGKQRSITIKQIMNEVMKFIKEKEKRQGNQISLVPQYLKNDEYKTLTAAITYIKNKMLSKDYCKNRKVYIDDTFYVPAADLMEAYDYILHDKYKACDYDDMLTYAYDGLKAHPEILRVIREKYNYWSIDEAQDNSPLQTALIKLLSKSPNNLFMVGDDDQSIYGFRGAEQMGLLEFGVEPETHIMTMGINYRSDSNIVNTAKAFVEGVQIRADKEMAANSVESGTVDMNSFMDEKAMLDYILKRVKEAERKQAISSLSGKKPSTSLAVLYRNNYPAISLVFLLHKNGISFKMGNGIKECISNPEIFKILNFMEFIINENSVDTFMKLHRRIGLPRCSKWDMEKLKTLASVHKNMPVYQVYLQHMISDSEDTNTKRILTKLNTLCDIYKNNKGVSAEDNKTCAMAKCIIQESSNSKGGNKKDKNTNPIDGRIYNALKLFASPDDFVKACHDICGFDDKKEDQYSAVDILTMHGSKGLQYDEVILTECIEKIGDHAKKDELEINSSNDGRRLFYVGMTRAKKRLCILQAKDPSIDFGKVINYFDEVSEICSKLGYNKPAKAKAADLHLLDAIWAS